MRAFLYREGVCSQEDIPLLSLNMTIYSGFLLLEVLYRSQAQEDFGMTLKMIFTKLKS